jgi:ABC-type transporter Mla MlaB component
MKHAAATAPPEIIAVGPDRLAIRGALTFDTARLASAEGVRALTASTAKRLEIDCAGVTAADSAGLAVCLVWLARAERDGRELSFANLPASIRALARISGIESVIDGA